MALSRWLKPWQSPCFNLFEVQCVLVDNIVRFTPFPRLRDSADSLGQPRFTIILYSCVHRLQTGMTVEEIKEIRHLLLPLLPMTRLQVWTVALVLLLLLPTIWFGFASMCKCVGA